MKSVKDNLTILRSLAYLPTVQKRALYNRLTNEQIRVIAEIAANYLAKVFKLPEKVKLSLSAKKAVIRKLASKGITDKKRREIIKKNSSVVSSFIKAALEKLINNV